MLRPSSGVQCWAISTIGVGMATVFVSGERQRVLIFTISVQCFVSEALCILFGVDARVKGSRIADPLRLRSGRAFDSAEVRSAPHQQGRLRAEVSRPCDRNKSQERGTEQLWYDVHPVRRDLPMQVVVLRSILEMNLGDGRLGRSVSDCFRMPCDSQALHSPRCGCRLVSTQPPSAARS